MLSETLDSLTCTLASLWPHLPAITGIVAPFLGVSTLSISGAFPRLGPGRAAWIALRSRFRRAETPFSLRNKELEQLGKLLNEKQWGQNYVVVTGEKGVGKSRLLSTATNKTAGVITVDTKPSDNKDDVVQKALRSLTNLKIKWLDPATSARRVIFWYRIFTLGRSPIVIINTAERKPGEPSPSLTGAVRSLVDKYGLRVLVDSSPNSVDETLLRTKRADVFEIQPMDKDMIFSLPQLNELFQLFRRTKLAGVAFAVLGGVPSEYEELWFRYKRQSKEGQDEEKLLGELLCGKVYDANKIIRNARSANPMLKEIINLFERDLGYIPCKLLESKDLMRSTPDKVFREVEISGEPVLIPASNAIDIVLRYNMSKKPTLEELVRIADDLALRKCVDQTSDGGAASHGLPTSPTGNIKKEKLPKCPAP